MQSRFENTGEHISTFADEFLVHCPRCNSCARIVPMLAENGVLNINLRRLLCATCTYMNEWHGPAGIYKYRATPDHDLSGVLIGAPVDWFFQQPLWLQRPCSGKILWAYNRRHLSYLKRYIEADLRDECSYPNTGLARYLPQWMKAAKNRDAILRCIEKIEQL